MAGTGWRWGKNRLTQETVGGCLAPSHAGRSRLIFQHLARAGPQLTNGIYQLPAASETAFVENASQILESDKRLQRSRTLFQPHAAVHRFDVEFAAAAANASFGVVVTGHAAQRSLDRQREISVQIAIHRTEPDVGA